MFFPLYLSFKKEPPEVGHAFPFLWILSLIALSIFAYASTSIERETVLKFIEDIANKASKVYSD